MGCAACPRAASRARARRAPPRPEDAERLPHGSRPDQARRLWHREADRTAVGADALRGTDCHVCGHALLHVTRALPRRGVRRQVGRMGARLRALRTRRTPACLSVAQPQLALCQGDARRARAAAAVLLEQPARPRALAPRRTALEPPLDQQPAQPSDAAPPRGRIRRRDARSARRGGAARTRGARGAS